MSSCELAVGWNKCNMWVTLLLSLNCRKRVGLWSFTVVYGKQIWRFSIIHFNRLWRVGTWYVHTFARTIKNQQCVYAMFRCFLVRLKAPVLHAPRFKLRLRKCLNNQLLCVGFKWLMFWILSIVQYVIFVVLWAPVYRALYSPNAKWISTLYYISYFWYIPFFYFLVFSYFFGTLKYSYFILIFSHTKIHEFSCLRKQNIYFFDFLFRSLFFFLFSHLKKNFNRITKTR